MGFVLTSGAAAIEYAARGEIPVQSEAATSCGVTRLGSRKTSAHGGHGGLQSD